MSKLETAQNSTKSSHALGASNIRRELKEKFPTIKFKVRSESYSMGSSIRVNWDDGVTVEEVREITAKYQEGHFDGMQDMYEYSKDHNSDLGGAKYVFESRNVSIEHEIAVCDKYGIEYEVKENSYSHTQYIDILDHNDRIRVNRVLSETSFYIAPEPKEQAKEELGGELNCNDVFESGTIESFTHTKTQEVLKVFKLGVTLSKEDFIAFKTWIKSSKNAYYSRYAKGFVLPTEDTEPEEQKAEPEAEAIVEAEPEEKTEPKEQKIEAIVEVEEVEVEEAEEATVKNCMRKETRLKVKELKENNQDFEFYPTTNEIMEAMKKDIVSLSHKISLGYNGGFKSELGSYSKGKDDIDYRKGYREEKDRLNIKSLLDIGSGDGRVIDYIAQDESGFDIRIDEKLAIEKATVQGDALIKRDIGLIGRDFFDLSLYEGKYSIVFSNPPYSEYKEWVNKIVKEINAQIIYLVIPERWQNDDTLRFSMEDKGEIEILGSYDFYDADREARAKVNLLRISNLGVSKRESEDTFSQWIRQEFGSFEPIEEIEALEEEEQQDKDELEQRSGDNVHVLVENYQRDLSKMKRNYRMLGEIDFTVIQQLGVSKADVLSKIRSDMAGLRVKYWKKSFELLEPITKRLTKKMRDNLMREIIWFDRLNFNASNVYTVVVWVIENSNKYMIEQAVEVFDKMVAPENVKAYKSNQKWTDGGWRYNNEQIPDKKILDYRVVVSGGVSYEGWSSPKIYHSIAHDLAVVAESFGFKNTGVDIGEVRKKQTVIQEDESVVFEFKHYQNTNMHIKFNKEFLMKLNVEIGKLKGWIMTPKDIQDEFDVKEEKALKLFGGNMLMLGKNNIPQIGL